MLMVELRSEARAIPQLIGYEVDAPGLVRCCSHELLFAISHRFSLVLWPLLHVAIVAWNSYPFQPRQWVDAVFTALLAVLGGGIIWVMAQMHRNPILSRITATTANELGLDFSLRIATFGAIPVLTWLAYQFPDRFGAVLRFIKPGLDVMK